MSERAQHVVLFKFPRDLTAEEERTAREHIRGWPEAIPGFTGLRFGRDVTGRSAGYSYLLLTEFESEDAHQAYYGHAAHMAFSDWVLGLGAEVIRVDYPLTDETLILEGGTR